jgi:hypothetical protein
MVLLALTAKLRPALKNFFNFSQFTKLKKKDQRQLLARNTPLYIQLYLSFYLSTPKSSELLQFIQSDSKISDIHIGQSCKSLKQWFKAISLIFR